MPLPQSLLKRFALLAAILGFGSAILSASCEAASEGKNIVPKSIAGMKMKYSDLHGNYVFSFAEDGTYSWTSGREGEKPEQRESGKYQWHLKGERNAVLELSGNDTYTLTFDSPTHAKGKVTDDDRTYSFTFEK